MIALSGQWGSTAIGQAMLKPKTLRPELSLEAHLLWRMHQALVSGGYAVLEGLHCELCGRQDELVCKCSMCLLHTHESCAVGVTELTLKKGCNKHILPHSMFSAFTSAPDSICPPCAASLAASIDVAAKPIAKPVAKRALTVS